MKTHTSQCHWSAQLKAGQGKEAGNTSLIGWGEQTCTITWYLEEASGNDCSRSRIHAIWMLYSGYVCDSHMRITCNLKVEVNLISSQSVIISLMLQDVLIAFNSGSFFLGVDHQLIPGNVFVACTCLSFNSPALHVIIHDLTSHGSYRIQHATTQWSE
jgi:hypothetical protein